jgi:hypothetical protein
LRKTVWWAREDSNLQPSGYERATLPGKISDYWHFCAGPMKFVRVWLRRIIGYLLVETHAREKPEITRLRRLGGRIDDPLADRDVADREIVVPVIAGGELGVDAETIEIEGGALGFRLDTQHYWISKFLG